MDGSSLFPRHTTTTQQQPAIKKPIKMAKLFAKTVLVLTALFFFGAHAQRHALEQQKQQQQEPQQQEQEHRTKPRRVVCAPIVELNVVPPFTDRILRLSRQKQID